MTEQPKTLKKQGLQPLLPQHGPIPAQFDEGDAVAVQALSLGKATAEQQKRALKWILEGACGLPIWPYCKDQRDTDVALGRHFVGQQIVGVLRAKISTLRR